MSQYIETIKLLDGYFKNLSFHQQRFEKTRVDNLGLKAHPLLEHVVNIPRGLEEGLLKCRIVYGRDIERIEFEPYVKRKISTLKLIESETISYRYKYADRADLDDLYQLRGPCDDILIVQYGCITDSYYANIVFLDQDKWITPDTPLLPGTMRASLLNKGLIEERKISVEDLSRFKKLRLINAMNSLEEASDIPLASVK